MTSIAIVGGGLAGLVAAVTATEQGADVAVFERADAPGGTTVLSSGWIWRYRDLKTFSWGAPHGDRDLQRALWDALPDALVWLERQGVRLLATGTRNPLTDGVRIDPTQAIDALARRLPAGALLTGWRVAGVRTTEAGDQFEVDVDRDGARRDPQAPGAARTMQFDAVIFAGGGYAADLARIEQEAGVDIEVSRHWAMRNSGQSDGSSLDAAVALGGHRVPATGESFCRAMPVGVRLWSEDFVRFSQVYGEHARLVDATGVLIERDAHDWADSLLLWKLARTGGHGWFVLDREALARSTPYGTVSKAVSLARDAGASVIECSRGDLPRLLGEQGIDVHGIALDAARDAVVAVAVRPGITHTLCGLRTDAHTRVVMGVPAHERRLALPLVAQRSAGARPVAPAHRVFAAGVDAGGVATGGYASGLAQALVQGRIAGAGAAGTEDD